MNAREPKKPFVFIVVAAAVLLLCGGAGVGGFVWMILKRSANSKSVAAQRGMPPGSPPGKNQRFELEYPEKADKESVSSRTRAPRDSAPSAPARSQPSLPENDLFAAGKFPAGYNPSGLFRKLEGTGVRSFAFHPNGTFVLEGTIELKTPNKREPVDGVDSDGKFSIEGTALALKFNNGESKELNIKPFEVFRDRAQSLLIDGEIFNRVSDGK